MITGVLSVPVTENATTRIIGLNPSLSCGISILQLNSQDQILSIDVGLLDVSCKTLLSDGARCNELQNLLSPLLSPLPDMAFIESYFVSPFRDPKDGKWKVKQEDTEINCKLRGSLEMLLEKQGIPYSYVAAETWKKDVVGDETADGEAVKDVLEGTMGFHFHPRLFSRTKCFYL